MVSCSPEVSSTGIVGPIWAISASFSAYLAPKILDLGERGVQERRRAGDLGHVADLAGRVVVELLALLGGLEEPEVVRVGRVGGEAAALGGAAEGRGRRAAGRARDVGLHHRRHVVILARVAGDHPSAGAVADDDHLLGAAAGGGDRGGAAGRRGHAVGAGLHVADDVVEHRPVGGGGERLPAAGMIEVAAAVVAEAVIGEDHVAGAGQGARHRPRRRVVPVDGVGGDPVDEHDRRRGRGHRALGEPLPVEHAAARRRGW